MKLTKDKLEEIRQSIEGRKKIDRSSDPNIDELMIKCQFGIVQCPVGMLLQHIEALEAEQACNTPPTSVVIETIE